ncbi:MAG TPA: dihydroorotase [Bacteroidales bacterium]|nr:dihydroorotase [Bacteroidales bacterium]
MNRNYLIKNALAINEGQIIRSDVLVLDGLIADMDGRIELPDDFIQQHDLEIIDASGKYLLPGVIDDQVHFREPGMEYKADIASESAAAVAGGVTSYMEMPNTKPPATTIELLEQKYSLAAEKSLANFSFYLGGTNDNYDQLLKFDPANHCGIKVFLGSSTGNLLTDDPEALQKIFSLPYLIAVHSEDEATIRKNVEIYRQKFGEDVPVEYHPMIRSAEACYISTKRAVALAEKNNTRLHILHLSTAAELGLLKRNVPLSEKRITTEVCVHHLWFNDTAYKSKGNFVKWNPAIKTEQDRQALFDAILDGTIDIVATDHAPHTLEEKQQLYFKAPSGGPLIQHSLQMMLEFYFKKQISLEKIVELMCHKPATCFNVENRGYLRKNYFADLVVADLQSTTTVGNDNILYKCKWSPLEGQLFHSEISHTFVNGHLVYDGQQVSDKIKGMRLRFKSK